MTPFVLSSLAEREVGVLRSRKPALSEAEGDPFHCGAGSSSAGNFYHGSLAGMAGGSYSSTHSPAEAPTHSRFRL